MNPRNQHTVFDGAPASLPVVYVARITPSRYSARKAISRYRHIQHFDVLQTLSSLIQVRG
jgi:hypothetical protein